jgi:carbon starvation protein
LIAYAFTYYVYSKYVDRKVWEVSAERTTPAHMYMDGVEFFPVSRNVLWGFQFKSIAALGPILGPFIAISYGWLPALIWIILGNMFIGWAHDYSSIMISVRNEGRSMGPLVYEYVGGERPRTILLGYLLFYLLIISAVFIFLIALFWNVFPGTFLSTLVILVAAIVIGQLLYKYQANIYGITLLAVFLVVIAVYVGVAVPWPPRNFLGDYTMLVWSLILAVFLFIASIAPMPTFITPMNFIAAFPAIAGVLILIIGALLSPLTGITLGQPSLGKPTVLMGIEGPGPIFPILFVAIACGAISGWHSLVGSSTTSKQLDVELDARPVGAGAMLTEGLLALSALAAYMVLPAGAEAIAKGKVSAFVTGATSLASGYLGGTAMAAYWTSFFALFLVIYAFTVQTLVTRYWRLVSGDLFTGTWSFLGNKYIATVVGLLIPILFSLSGSWINLWIYFGGSNQLLAGLALFLAAIIVTRMKRPSLYALGPAVFMIFVTLTALGWETYDYVRRVLKFLATNDVGVLYANPPLKNIPWAAFAMNVVFVIVGIILIGLGITMAYYLASSYSRAKAME